MTATLAAALLAAVAAASDTADDPAKTAQTRAQVNEYLGSDEPVTRERWRGLGQKAMPFLAKVATDQDASPARRLKAVNGIMAVGNENDAQLLLGLAQSDAEPLALRVASLKGGVKLLPAKKRLAAVRPLLKSAKPARMRAAAAEIMTRQSRRECAPVQAQVDREKGKERALFQRALRRCPNAAPAPGATPTAEPEAPATK